MRGFGIEEVGARLAAAEMNPGDWDLAELADVMQNQWAQVESIRAWVEQTDEPSLVFNPRWE